MQSAGFEGYKSKSSFIGKTDYDIFSKDIAERYRKNDLDVMGAWKRVIFGRANHFV